METILSPVAATDLRHNLTFNREQTLEKLYARAYPMVLHYIKQHQGTADDALLIEHTEDPAGKARQASRHADYIYRFVAVRLHS